MSEYSDSYFVLVGAACMRPFLKQTKDLNGRARVKTPEEEIRT